MVFEWDDHKNAANAKKHGIRFENAIGIFQGPVLTWIDDRADYGETRHISIGALEGVLVIVVVHTARRKATRIISARRANRRERKRYHEACKNIPE